MRTLLAEPCPPQFPAAEIAAGPEASREPAGQAARILPDAAGLSSSDDLEVGVDGVVTATPGTLHAEQAVTAPERGLAVFDRKPPGHPVIT